MPTYLLKSSRPEHIASAEAYFRKLSAHRKVWFEFAKRFGVDSVFFSQFDMRFLGLDLGKDTQTTYGREAWTIHKRSGIALPRQSGKAKSKELLEEWKTNMPKEYSSLTPGELSEALGGPRMDPFVHRLGCKLLTGPEGKTLLVQANFLLPEFTEITASEYEALKALYVEH